MACRVSAGKEPKDPELLKNRRACACWQLYMLYYMPLTLLTMRLHDLSVSAGKDPGLVKEHAFAGFSDIRAAPHAAQHAAVMCLPVQARTPRTHRLNHCWQLCVRCSTLLTMRLCDLSCGLSCVCRPGPQGP
jgi:hypothetical protein